MSGKTQKLLRRLVRESAQNPAVSDARLAALKRGYGRTPSTSRRQLLDQLAKAVDLFQSMQATDAATTLSSPPTDPAV